MRSVVYRRFAIAFVGLGTLFAGMGCERRGTEPSANAKAEVSAPANVSAEPSWPLTGEIVTVNRERKTLLVTHDEIPGFMPRMTMEFLVSEGDLAIAREGSRIRATLVQRGEEFALEQIWPADPKTEQALAEGVELVKRETQALTRRTHTFRDLGDTAPSFVLYDQDGRVTDGARFRGKRVVLNFIYTRCPIATMCPAATQRMIELQRAAADAGIKDLELVSISLDPEYDTPGVLKEYASTRGIDTRNFSFLTGPEEAIKNLLRQLNVVSYFEDGIIKHSLNTLLIGTDGRILYRHDTEAWRVEDFLSRLRSH